MLFTSFKQDALDIVEKFGESQQLKQIQEELMELAVAISHLQRNKENALSEVVSEFVDVLFMMEQLLYILQKNKKQSVSLINAKEALSNKIKLMLSDYT